MTKTRLAVALSFGLLMLPMAKGAQYRVIELPVASEGLNSFPSAINSDGQITVNVQPVYNIPLDPELIDFEAQFIIDSLTDIDAAKSGDFNTEDYLFIRALFDGTTIPAQLAQQFANISSYVASPDSSEFVPGFDQILPSGEYSFGSTSIARDINNSGYVVGTGQDNFVKFPYTLMSGVEGNFVINDFGNHGFAHINGNVVDLPPPDTTLGGISEASSINNNNQVAGVGTTDFVSSALQTGLTNCSDDTMRGDVPIEACIHLLVTTFSGAVNNSAQTRGLIWQLDDQGNLLDTQELGLLFTPEADDTTIYSSQASSINDNGIAVGQAHGEYTEGSNTVIRTYAAIFNGDQVINITPEPDTNAARFSSLISTALDINNDNLVVGHQLKSVNGTNRTKFFVYDMNANELTSPNDFFLGSSSVALDINNNGIVVGYGEIDAARTGRRTEGFIYNHNNQEFTGLKSLLSCESPYSIVQANAINDNGEIAATALVQQPSRNRRGEIILDSNGEQILRDAVIPVLLEPIPGGSIEDCTDSTDELNRERQGAGIFWLLLLGAASIRLNRFRKAK